VSVGVYRYLWIYPRWWWDAAAGNSLHRIRKTKLVKRSRESSGGVAPPSPADKIKQQADRRTTTQTDASERERAHTRSHARTRT
jgi:hypothetical protein